MVDRRATRKSFGTMQIPGNAAFAISVIETPSSLVLTGLGSSTIASSSMSSSSAADQLRQTHHTFELGRCVCQRLQQKTMGIGPFHEPAHVSITFSIILILRKGQDDIDVPTNEANLGIRVETVEHSSVVRRPKRKPVPKLTCLRMFDNVPSAMTRDSSDEPSEARTSSTLRT
jgi:hypothetical protein